MKDHHFSHLNNHPTSLRHRGLHQNNLLFHDQYTNPCQSSISQLQLIEFQIDRKWLWLEVLPYFCDTIALTFSKLITISYVQELQLCSWNTVLVKLSRHWTLDQETCTVYSIYVIYVTNDGWDRNIRIKTCHG